MADPAPPTPPKPRRKHRWLKLLVVVVIGLAIAVAIVQGVLWSDYPRRIGIRIAQDITGLRVDMRKLTLTWSGATTIEDLRVALPLADKPFLTVPRVDARHTPLLGVLFTLNVAIDSVTVDRPGVDVRQDTDGVWNLQQVLNQLATPGKNAAAGGTTRLPNVDLKDAVVRVTRADGRSVELNDVDLVGRRDGDLVWKFDGHAADLATVAGQVSASGRWPHEVGLVLRPGLVNAVEPLVGPIGTFANARLDWQGERTPTGVTGRLTIPEKTTQAGPIIAHGATRISVDGADITVNPDGLTVIAPGVPAVTLAGGSATVSGASLRLVGIRTRFADGSMRLDGSVDLSKQRGSMTASWEQIAFPPGTVHEGRVTLEAANIWPGRPWVKGEMNLLGTLAGGTFETRASLTGDGPRWADATYVVDLPVARYSRKSELRVEDIQAVIHNTAETVELQSVRVRQSATGPATLDAHGQYHFAGLNKSTGYLTAVGTGFLFGTERNLAFNVNAWADQGTINLQNAYARIGTQAWANLTGQYVSSRPEPVGMRLDFATDPNLSLNLSRNVSVAGNASGSLRINGTLEPANVRIDGNLASRQLKVDRFLIGDADLVVRGLLHADGANLETERLRVFGGEGWFGVDYPYFGDQINAKMGFADIRLADLGRAVSRDTVSGTASGNLDLHIPVGDLQSMYGTGRVDLDRPVVRPLLEAQTLRMPIRIGDGYVSVAPAARQEAGGTAGVRALVNLADPTKFKLNVDLKNWLTQLPLQEFSTLTTGRVDVPQFDLTARAVSGQVDVRNQFFSHDKPIGDVGVRLKADGRQVKLDSVDGDILGGRVYGQGTLNFNDLALGRLQAGIVGMSLDRLARLDPRLVGMQGNLSATLDSHASDTPDPLGPVQTDIDVKSDRATYKGIEIGDSRLRIFADRTRIALADDPQRPNYVSLAGGTARLWGRLSQVPAGEDGVSRTSAFASVKLDRLDTEQLNRMVDPDGKPVPGRLSGTVTAFGNPADPKRMSGQGRLELTDSDLGNIGVIAALYNAMRLGFAPSVPTGEGNVAFRLNSGRLDVTSLDYFNRGVYARGALSLDDVLDLKNSPVNGYVLGTFRPLKDIKLPFLGTLDSILDALQSSATTIKVEGTVSQIKATPVSLKQVGGNLRNILIGEAQAK
ncbi:MAG TPA: hypothetical protein VF595_08930 [Tepidisphaeraceae bacterium]|jgi:hypothetical protein